MPAYVTRSSVWLDNWDQYSTLPTVTVSEPDREPVSIGLLNAQGQPLYRVPDRHPMGFDTTPRAVKGPH